MGLKGILSVAGKGGLFKVVAQTRNGFIVESMINGKREPVNAAHQISMLDDISVFTQSEEVPLKDVFLKMKAMETEYASLDLKGDPKLLRDFFGRVLPDFDENRVYNSDIKKMLSWFSYVKDVVDKEDEENEMMDKIKLSESDQPLDHGNSSSKVKTTESKASSQRSRTKV